MQIKEGLPAKLEQDPEAEEVSLLTGQAYGDAAAVNVDRQDPLELGLRKVGSLCSTEVPDACLLRAPN